MEAFILAAGLGTRLQPLTNTRPKALVEIGGTTLLERNIANLAKYGFRKIVVNIHHFPDMMTEFLNTHHFDAEILISDERDKLLDTGGALKKASKLFSGTVPIMIHNVDILSSINLKDAYDRHVRDGNFATLLASRRQTSRYLLFDDTGNLAGWENTAKSETLWTGQPVQNATSLAFSGIHIVNPELPEMLPQEDTYPIIPEYLRLAKDHKVRCLEHSAEKWLDVGKPETLKLAESFVAR